MRLWKRIFGVKESAKADLVRGKSTRPFTASNMQPPPVEGLEAIIYGSDEISVHDAIKASDDERIRWLLDKSPEKAFSKDKDGWTPLHLAAFLGETPIAKLLLAKSAEVDAKLESGQTPLHLAARKAHKSTAELLLAHGADVNAKTQIGETPLHKAAAGDEWANDWACKAMVELLVANHAEVEIKNSNGLTPLDVAEKNNRKPVAEYLRQTLQNIRPASVSSKLRLPKPSRIYVAGNGFIPGKEEIILGVRGFFARHDNLERDLPPGVEMEGRFAFGADAMQFSEVALSSMFGDDRHPNAYYLDAVLLAPSGQQMMVVVLWDGEAASAAKQQVPNGTQR